MGTDCVKKITLLYSHLSASIRYDSVSFFKPVMNSIKTVSGRLPRVLEPSVYAGLRDFCSFPLLLTLKMTKTLIVTTRP